MQIKLFKKKKVFKKGGIHTSPDVYWNIIQLTALAMVIASFVFGFFLFRNINNALKFVPKNLSDKNGVEGERLSKALYYFKSKEDISQNVINSPSPIVDPSR